MVSNAGPSAPDPRAGQRHERIAGAVERVTFHSGETGFCVLRVKVRGPRDLVTVTGHAAAIGAGEYVEAAGFWLNDRQHGLQFRPSGSRPRCQPPFRGWRSTSAPA